MHNLRLIESLLQKYLMAYFLLVIMRFKTVSHDTKNSENNRIIEAKYNLGDHSQL